MPIWLPNDNFVNLNSTAIGGQLSAFQMSSTWKLDLDMLDLVLSRLFFQSPFISIFPMGGLRALWISQDYNIKALSPAATANSGVGFPGPAVTSRNNSTNWGIGPTLNLAIKGLIAYGFRAEWNLGLSIIATKFTQLNHYENDGVNGGPPINGTLAPVTTLCPIVDMGLGLGWGSYFKYKTYHLDFVAKYDFSIFAKQNLMRKTTSALANNTVGYDNPIGDLFLCHLSKWNVDCRIKYKPIH